MVDDQTADDRVKDDQAGGAAAAPSPAANTDQAPEADELHAQLLRVRADFENFKRRVESERGAITQVARTDVILDLLPVVDNFDRAFADVPADIEKSQWYQGVQAIKQQFEKVLQGLGVERIESVGKPFDPNLHEAVTHEPDDAHDKDVITKEFEAGYRLGDQVIRHARVQVSAGKETK